MKTELCNRLKIEVPIIQAAMGGAGGPALAAAVSNAGGLGMLALWGADLTVLRDQIRRTRSLTSRPFGVNLNLQWSQEERLQVCLEEGIPVISLFWGDPAPLVEKAHAGGAIVLHTSSSAAEARRSVDGGVDVIVAQGWEAGGHVRGSVATLPLIPSVCDAVSPTPVIAAGGIADGRGLAAVLALGAAGAWIGTRFLASPEGGIHRRYQERLLQSTEDGTVLTTLFDIGWPDAPHRVLRNETYEQWIDAGMPQSGKRPGEGEVVATSKRLGDIVRYRSYTAGVDTEGDVDSLSLWAGQSVGLVGSVKSAGEIVHEIVAEADAILRRLSGS
ncbi:MAG TPA: nitronate monooxygenase [Acetobacteraceae bacterium]|jgi:NAD(P)H-dependent flavin oxidoreductase YrpB (nitropropane dioxygenase family)|nr:nitronate monooxygenase [Acetobacteraceae bacterium]